MSAQMIVRSVRQLIRDERGVTTTEYAVMLALILLASIGAITAYQNTVAQKWTEIQQAIN